MSPIEESQKGSTRGASPIVEAMWRRHVERQEVLIVRYQHEVPGSREVLRTIVVQLRPGPAVGDFDVVSVTVEPGPSGVLTVDEVAGLHWRRTLRAVHRMARGQFAVETGQRKGRRTFAEAHPDVLRDIADIVRSHEREGRPAYIDEVVALLKSRKLPAYDSRTAKRRVAEARDVGLLGPPRHRKAKTVEESEEPIPVVPPANPTGDPLFEAAFDEWLSTAVRPWWTTMLERTGLATWVHRPTGRTARK